MPLGQVGEWTKLGKEWSKHYRNLSRRISEGTFLTFDTKMFKVLGIEEPSRVAQSGFYFEIRAPKVGLKKRKKRKNGFRSTKNGEWHSNTKGTNLENYDMTPERIWRLCFAALYAANAEKPNGNRMAKLSGLGRTNSYAFLEKKLLPEIRRLEKALSLPKDPVDRAISVVKSLLSKKDPTVDRRRTRTLHV